MPATIYILWKHHNETRYYLTRTKFCRLKRGIKYDHFLIDIFHDAKNKFADIDFELTDDASALAAMFGQSGLDAIRDAEQCAN
jgi:hypothetical protein